MKKTSGLQPHATIVIPARQGSTRFPGKPMALVEGKALLHRVWEIAEAVKYPHETWIATDDEGIQQFAQSFGAQVLMTRPECVNGTERVYEAVSQLQKDSDPEKKSEIVINLQGDAVLTPPWIIDAVLNEMASDSRILIATPATQLSWKQYDEFAQSKAQGRASGTLVVFNLANEALYFSKGIIPFVRERTAAEPPIYRHIGLYGYRYEALKTYVSLKPTPLEEMEKLEQLRALENGIPIRIVKVDYRGRTHWSIDNPEDIAIAEKILKREGELTS